MAIEDKDAFKVMARYAWDAIWYANPFSATQSWYHDLPDEEAPLNDKKGRWHCGVWTGPQNDLLCLIKCDTNEEGEKWLSPPGDTPLDAIAAAEIKIKSLIGGKI